MKLLKILAFSLALAGCTAGATPAPVETGSGINELKKSPCACTEIPMVIPPSIAG